MQGILIDKLNGKVALLRGKIQQMARTNKELLVALDKANGEARRTVSTNEGDQPSSRNESFKLQVVEAIYKVLARYSRWSTKHTGTLVAQAVWAWEGFLPELLKLSRKHF